MEEGKFTYIIRLNDEEVKRFEDQTNYFGPFKWLLDHQSQSTDYALRYGGYSVEYINQETKESRFWTHSGNRAK